jgi:hypothetical protein
VWAKPTSWQNHDVRAEPASSGQSPHHPGKDLGKDLGKAQGFASGEARIKARMTSELRSDHVGGANMTCGRSPHHPRKARMTCSLCDHHPRFVWVTSELHPDDVWAKPTSWGLCRYDVIHCQNKIIK